MANGLQLNTSTVVGGLATQTFTVATAGYYTVEVNYDIPYRPAGSSENSASTVGGSSLQVLVKLNSTTKLTLSSPAPTQPKLTGSVLILAAAADVITVVPSSADADDIGLNAIKGVVNLYQGF